MNKHSKSAKTVSKGYRLMPSTHRLISEVQEELNMTCDRLISSAVILLKNSNKDKFNIKNNK